MGDGAFPVWVPFSDFQRGELCVIKVGPLGRTARLVAQAKSSITTPAKLRLFAPSLRVAFNTFRIGRFGRFCLG